MTEYSSVLIRQLGIGERRLYKAYFGDDLAETTRFVISDRDWKPTPHFLNCLNQSKQPSNCTTENNQSFQKTVMRKSNFSSTGVTRQVICVQMKAARDPLSTRSRQTDECLDSKVSYCPDNSTQTKHSCKLVTHSCTSPNSSMYYLVSLSRLKGIERTKIHNTTHCHRDQSLITVMSQVMFLIYTINCVNLLLNYSSLYVYMCLCMYFLNHVLQACKCVCDILCGYESVDTYKVMYVNFYPLIVLS